MGMSKAGRAATITQLRIYVVATMTECLSSDPCGPGNIIQSISHRVAFLPSIEPACCRVLGIAGHFGNQTEPLLVHVQLVVALI